jgi:hypothetical protein
VRAALKSLFVTELAVSVGSAVVALGSMVAAFVSVRIARKSANAATRSADVAEVVERGRHYGWRIEGRTTDTDTDTPRKVYTLRNVGTIDARNVTPTGDYNDLRFADDQSSADVAAGQARLIVVTRMGAARGGEIHITWTPDQPDAEAKTWTETPPVG